MLLQSFGIVARFGKAKASVESRRVLFAAGNGFIAAGAGALLAVALLMLVALARFAASVNDWLCAVPHYLPKRPMLPLP